jgi:hypothetical protein
MSPRLVRLSCRALLALLFGCVGAAMATAQQPDRIVIAGERHALLSNPFEQYRRQHPGLDLQQQEGADVVCMHSANHRGYIATFRIQDGQLLLDDIVMPACEGTEAKSLRHALFGTDKAVSAAWFTGILVVPAGERIEYVHLGYGSMYERYRLHRVENGRVVETTTMQIDAYRRYRERQFRSHRATQAYREALASMLAEGDWTEEGAERFLFSVDTDYATDIALPFESPAH